MKTILSAMLILVTLVSSAQFSSKKEEKPPEEPEEIPAVVPGLSFEKAHCEAPEEVLQSLSNERALILQQRDDLDEKAAELALAREKLRMEKAALLELEEAIQVLLARVEDAKTDDVNRLIDLYRNMKPADAALIMDDLDIETTIMILGTMKPRIAAPIMAKMSPIRVRAVSKIILERSQLPGDQDLTGIRLK